MDKATFKGIEYPIRTVDIPGYGQRRVSKRSLEKVLLTKDDCWVNKEAEEIDNSIFFYVPDQMFEDDEADLAKFIFNEVDGAGF